MSGWAIGYPELTLLKPWRKELAQHLTTLEVPQLRCNTSREYEAVHIHQKTQTEGRQVDLAEKEKCSHKFHHLTCLWKEKKKLGIS